MTKITKRDNIILRLIANTLKRKRNNNLIEIAEDIEWLEKELGSLKNASKIVGVSAQMLRKFLSVRHLCPEVKMLVQERKLDSVTIVHLMRDFDEKEQKVIAHKAILGQLSVDHMKALVPLSKKLKNIDIELLIKRVIKSRDYKVYLVRFILADTHENLKEIKKRFQNIVGKENLISITLMGNVASVELTFLGQKRLRKAAKERKKTLRIFIDNLIMK